jgi:hypothetical protein
VTFFGSGIPFTLYLLVKHSSPLSPATSSLDHRSVLSFICRGPLSSLPPFLTMLPHSLLALFSAVSPVLAGLAGTFQTAGDTQVSAMMVR